MEFIIAADLTNLANIYHYAKGLPAVRKVRTAAGRKVCALTDEMRTSRRITL
jgi:hypothetical protein